MRYWALEDADAERSMPFDVAIEVPALDAEQRALVAAQAEPATSQFPAIELQRVAALAAADTIPIPKAARPAVPATSRLGELSDTHETAIVDTALYANRLRERESAPAKASFDVRKVIWSIAFVVLGAVVLTAAILAIQYQADKLGPRSQAMQYAGLIVAGNIEEAGVLAPHTNATGPLLTNEAYQAALNRPASAEMSELSIEGSNAVVTVTYKLANSDEVTQQYHLTKSGKAFLVFDRWTFEPFALATAEISQSQPGNVTISGISVNVDVSGSALSLPAYPGSYPIAYKDPNGIYGDLADLAEVATTGSERIDLAPTPTEQGRAKVSAQAEEQLRSTVDQCAASKLLDAGCGAPLNAIGQSLQGQKVTMKVSDYPKVEVRYVDGIWQYAALGGHITVSGAGEARVQNFNSIGTLIVAADGSVSLNPSPLQDSGAEPTGADQGDVGAMV